MLRMCDGIRSMEEIVRELETRFETTGLADDIAELLEAAHQNGWITGANKEPAA
ncbi:MAG: PqqD family peptide modification chaperone [Methylococcaceae bacterium]